MVDGRGTAVLEKGDGFGDAFSQHTTEGQECSPVLRHSLVVNLLLVILSLEKAVQELPVRLNLVEGQSTVHLVLMSVLVVEAEKF